MAKTTEWAVELRPQNLNQMVGVDTNKEIVQGWIDKGNLPNSIIFYGRSGTGKALKNGTLVLTDEAYRPIETLKVGDLVAGADGQLHKVEGVFPQGVKDLYEITFSRGIKITASGDHIWTISKDGGKTFIDTTTEELSKETYVKAQLPKVLPIEMPVQEQPIDPYLLGVLAVTLASADYLFFLPLLEEGVVTEVDRILRKDFNIALHTLVDMGNKPLGYYFDVVEGQEDKRELFFQYLEACGITSEPANRTVAANYLFGTVEQRRRFLAGIADVALVLSRDKKEFSLSALGVISAIKFITDTLGITSGLTDEHTVVIHTSEVLSLYGHNRSNEEMLLTRNYSIRIEKIKKVEDGECTCISVDSPDHLFIIENGIPTHNTTMSRIIAKQLNAELTELDAASHNSVDDARQLNEQATRLSLTGRRKIFLIDEAHSLSNQAWQALLKSIEEPNELVTFIFCTTDYSKLPATIRGRSRMLKFYSVTPENLKEYAQAVIEHQGYQLKDEVIDLIVKRANGQVRDLLKLLQTTCEGNLNDIEKLKKFLAIPDTKGMRSFINATLSHTPKSGLAVLNSIDTDLLEWILALQAHIYELLEDKYKIREINCGNNITTRNQIKAIEEKFTDKQFGLLLTELNKITSANTAYAQLYALLFRGVD